MNTEPSSSPISDALFAESLKNQYERRYPETKSSKNTLTQSLAKTQQKARPETPKSGALLTAQKALGVGLMGIGFTAAAATAPISLPLLFLGGTIGLGIGEAMKHLKLTKHDDAGKTGLLIGAGVASTVIGALVAGGAFLIKDANTKKSNLKDANNKAPISKNETNQNIGNKGIGATSEIKLNKASQSEVESSDESEVESSDDESLSEKGIENSDSQAEKKPIATQKEKDISVKDPSIQKEISSRSSRILFLEEEMGYNEGQLKKLDEAEDKLSPMQYEERGKINDSRRGLTIANGKCLKEKNGLLEEIKSLKQAETVKNYLNQTRSAMDNTEGDVLQADFNVNETNPIRQTSGPKYNDFFESLNKEVGAKVKLQKIHAEIKSKEEAYGKKLKTKKKLSEESQKSHVLNRDKDIAKINLQKKEDELNNLDQELTELDNQRKLALAELENLKINTDQAYTDAVNGK